MALPVIPHLFVTGPPGCGKTTVIRQVLASINPHVPISGFFTSEIREKGTRVGFSVKTIAGKEGILAHVNLRSPHRVGRYGVDVACFEEIVLSDLAAGNYFLYVIDEIGKMECHSKRFCEAVRELLSRNIPVIGTIASQGGGFIGEVRNRKDITIWPVTPENRSLLPRKILEFITPYLTQGPSEKNT